MSIFIGGAWPYANGSLHLGHIAGLLPGDIVARYYRQKGEEVLYVSGSDCNGTPIAIRARQEGKDVSTITDYYHQEFVHCFEQLGFTFDLFSRTDKETHHQVVQELFKDLLDKNLIYKKTVQQSFCEECDQFLPDRYVEGTCPHCLAEARGDQCDTCSSILDPLDLLHRKCKLCSQSPTVKDTEHFYFALSLFQTKLEAFLQEAKINGTWRENAIHLTERYLKEGLHDRAVSRDLSIGISVPVAGFEDKKIYVWIEAVSGYLSSSIEWGKTMNKDWEGFWNPDAPEGKAYYVHGKDNIPFHTIIWPALLLGKEKLKLPSHIISNEYLTLERKKISTSKNYAVWLPDLLSNYHPDSIRYYVTINAPEKRDADFSWREFVHSHNGELLGAYGNFVNRTLKFIEKSFDSKIPQGTMDLKLKARITELYKIVGSKIENGECKVAIELIFDLIRGANKYFDLQKPWVTAIENEIDCHNTLYTCVQVIVNLSNLLSPFLPFSTEQIRGYLNMNEQPSWKYIQTSNTTINNITALYERIDPSAIEKERNKLGLSS
ncbi:methionine--tRNA ligase [Bacillus sp. DJP31]|uniref:methionine--tRNA ligase n=1 Tax=Bacillus sp. DJP31 TaxID=3409789 RepID=UPI003BB5758C